MIPGGLRREAGAMGGVLSGSVVVLSGPKKKYIFVFVMREMFARRDKT